jgi:predicted alpha-1,6-mannanase (GH76 family)
MSRRVGRAVLATIVTAAGVMTTVSPARATESGEGIATATAKSRATAAYKALEKYFDAGQGLLLEEYPNTHQNPYSYIWPYSQAAIAVETLAGVPGAGYQREARARLATYEKYWNAGTTPPGYDSYVRPPLGHGGDKFYDDNEWIGLHLVQYHKRTGSRDALVRAKEIFKLVVHGWDTDPSHPCPGGVFWTQATWSNDRNTVSNGPGAELGLHLYLLTRDRYYLTWAKKMYDWTNDCLLAPNGLYWDHIDLAGTIEKTQWSYNQGVMLGASTLLYKATGQKHYLDKAKAIARAALEFYGAEDRLWKQPARFNMIFFKNLMILDSVAHNPVYKRTMQAYADRAYEQARDPETGLYYFVPGPVQLLEQATPVQLNALLAWPRSQYRLLA